MAEYNRDKVRKLEQEIALKPGNKFVGGELGDGEPSPATKKCNLCGNDSDSRLWRWGRCPHCGEATDRSGAAQEVSPPSPQSFDEWWAESRKLNPDCGCEQRGQRWFKCSYHEGADDAWDAKRLGDTRELKAALWIQVQEKLPEYGTVSLVYGYNEDTEKIPYQDIATYSYHGGWCVGLDKSVEYVVTHWQYLPEPPELG